MTIQAITDSFASSEKQASNISMMRAHFNEASKHETVTAIDAIHHYFQHNCSATVVNAKKAFADYGTKQGAQAFTYLAFNFTGAKESLKKDQERHDKALPNYQAELAAIEEMGLAVWYKSKMATEADKEELTPEQKKEKKEKAQAAKKEQVGKDYLEEMLKNDPSMALAMQWREAYNALAIKNPSMAAEMAQSSINKLTDGLSTVLRSLVA